MSQSNVKVGKVFQGKYKIIKLIGEGGMGDVFLAENVNSTEKDHFSKNFKYVAIKFITKKEDTTNEQWNKILDEGVTNARLTESDNIVKLYEMHQLDKNTIALVIEYVEGSDLKKIIKNRGCLTIPEALYIFKKILAGVIDMHSKDRVIIHRDLKPENILISDDMLNVKIADFGISSVLIRNQDETEELLTDEKSLFGTIPYLTPDAICNIENGKSPKISKQFDFHALGVIFYEMLVGDKPFEINDENNPKTIMYWTTYDITPMKFINSNIRNELENIILRLTASKDNLVKYRYKNVNEILKDIEQLEYKISQNMPEDATLVPYSERHFQKEKEISLIDNSRMNIFRKIKINSSLAATTILFGVFSFLLIVFFVFIFVW